MVPHVDRHIDRKHALTHDINAEDEVLLTVNPSRDQQVVRKAYADSLVGAGGTWTPGTVWRFNALGFRQPDFGSFRGGGAGTRFLHLALYAGTNKSYAKVGWRVSDAGSPTVGIAPSSNKYRFITQGAFLSIQTGGSHFGGMLFGTRAPQLGSDYFPDAGTFSAGFVFQGTHLYGLVRGAGTRAKVSLGYPGGNTRVTLILGSWGARWLAARTSGFSATGSTRLAGGDSGGDSGLNYLYYFALNRRTNIGNKVYVAGATLEQLSPSA